NATFIMTTVFNQSKVVAPSNDPDAPSACRNRHPSAHPGPLTISQSWRCLASFRGIPWHGSCPSHGTDRCAVTSGSDYWLRPCRGARAPAASLRALRRARRLVAGGRELSNMTAIRYSPSKFARGPDCNPSPSAPYPLAGRSIAYGTAPLLPLPAWKG